jgi:hypothetical protein
MLVQPRMVCYQTHGAAGIPPIKGGSSMAYYGEIITRVLNEEGC